MRKQRAENREQRIAGRGDCSLFAVHCLLQRGMTFIETIVWIALFTSAMLAITTSAIAYYRASDHALETTTATVSAQRGVDGLVRTIREVAYASDGAYPIVSLTANSITLYADIDTDPQIERVRYYLSGTQLLKGVVHPVGDPASYSGVETVSVLADNVRNTTEGVPLFIYYDKNGAAVVDYSKIATVRFVSIQLLVTVDKNHAPGVITLRSSAALRNLIGK